MKLYKVLFFSCHSHTLIPVKFPVTSLIFARIFPIISTVRIFLKTIVLCTNSKKLNVYEKEQLTICIDVGNVTF